jgi:hypothetical protein
MHDIAPLRTVAPTSVRRPRLTLNIELLGLIATSISVLLGVVLVHAGKVARLDEVSGPGAVIPLYALKSPADLDPVLTMFTSPAERQTVALALYRRAAAEPPLDHVGALADVTIPLATHHLSRADIVSMKPRLAVRNSTPAWGVRCWPSSAPSGSRICSAAGGVDPMIRWCCRRSCYSAASA